MIEIYRAATLVEAQMLQHMLEQQGVHVALQGEQLQTGIGDFGFTRLLVDSQHYDLAYSMLVRWGEQQAAEKSAPSKERRSVLMVVAGSAFFVGCLVMLIVIMFLPNDLRPIAKSEIDNNSDEKADEFWKYNSGGVLELIESDRNFDGKIDMRQHYAADKLKTISEDTDFDGVFETEHRYKNANIEVTSVDTNNDKNADLKSYYEFGVLKSTEYIDALTKKVARKDYFSKGLLVKSEHDLNEDAVLETLRTYDATGELVKEQIISSTKAKK